MDNPAQPVGGAVYSKHRIEALADGVFAVVPTLLVLEIKPAFTPSPWGWGSRP
jgi:uncharacterized membrane protein